jgi:hypothetical protein
MFVVQPARDVGTYYDAGVYSEHEFLGPRNWLFEVLSLNLSCGSSGS